MADFATMIIGSYLTAPSGPSGPGAGGDSPTVVILAAIGIAIVAVIGIVFTISKRRKG